MDAILHRRHDLMVVADVFLRLAFHNGDTGAHHARIPDAGPGAHPECLGLVGGGDAAACLRHHRCHPHRPPPQPGIEVLLHAREIRVAVNEQGCQRAGHADRMARGRTRVNAGKCSIELEIGISGHCPGDGFLSRASENRHYPPGFTYREKHWRSHAPAAARQNLAAR